MKPVELLVEPGPPVELEPTMWMPVPAENLEALLLVRFYRRRSIYSAIANKALKKVAFEAAAVAVECVVLMAEETDVTEVRIERRSLALPGDSHPSHQDVG